MKRGKKKKPNVNLIQTSRSYTIREVAARLDRQVHTVRAWVKDGLPVLPDTTPRLIDGAELKAWLKAKWAKRKMPCGLGELFCCKCCKQRAPDPNSVQTEPAAVAASTLIKGKCGECATPMQQVRKTADLPEILREMMGKAKADSNLTDYRDPRANAPLWLGQGAFDFEQYEGGSGSVH